MDHPTYNGEPLTAPCGFCQGDGRELTGAHTDHERWIACTHCGGHGYGLTREQAEHRARQREATH